MAAEAERQPRPLRRWLQKVRESWRQAGAISDRTRAARRAYDDKADRQGFGGGGGFGGPKAVSLAPAGAS